MLDETNKANWIDYARVIAIVMVILLHTSAPLLHQFNDLPAHYWLTANIYDSIVRVSVPIFFLVSGHLLLRKSEPISTFLSKRMNKLLLPFVFWSLFFVFWKGFVENNTGVSFWHIYSLILQPSYYHLWFLYALIGIYLFIPLLRLITKEIENKVFFYYLTLWFFSVAIIPIVEKVIHTDSHYDLFSFSGFVGYFLLGHYLGSKTYSKKVAVKALIVFICATLITAYGTYYLTLHNQGVFSGYFYELSSPNVIIASIAIFILIKHSFDKDKVYSGKVSGWIKSISDCSFGIYFTHVIFLYLLKEGYKGINLSGSVGEPFIYILITACCTFLLSYITVLLIRKIPYMNRITP
jgi:surface polysaccharide O-acyltransferase-like enzyme